MSTVDLRVDAGIALLTLARPDQLNALNLALAAELLAAIRSLETRDDVAVLMLAGQGRAFCAGGDVAEMAASGDPAGYLGALTRDVHEALALLRELPIPVVAKVDGAVAGGGLGVMLSADVVICSDRATFTPAYGALGLSPDCGTTVLVPEAVGPRRARELFLVGRRLDAETAREWGLVAEVVTPEKLDERATAVARGMLEPGSYSAASTRRLLSTPAVDFRRALATEAQEISALAGTDVARQRVARFARG